MIPASDIPQSAYDFYFADPNTLYVADDRTLANGGGIQKWAFDGLTWTLQYTLSTGLTHSCRGLTASTSGGITTLWATSSDATTGSTGNKLITTVDTGASSAFTTVATAPANTAYRGIDFAPEGGGPAPCYANCDGSTTPPILNVLDFVCFQTLYARALARQLRRLHHRAHPQRPGLHLLPVRLRRRAARSTGFQPVEPSDNPRCPYSVACPWAGSPFPRRRASPPGCAGFPKAGLT